jgi:acylphosphatase
MKTAETGKSKVRAHVTIAGSVQGVFFRMETKHVANVHRVVGWIRNLPDGRVEAVFEGEEQNVKRLVEFCRKGPSGARVDSVDVCWEKFSGSFSGFEIRHD